MVQKHHQCFGDAQNSAGSNFFYCSLLINWMGIVCSLVKLNISKYLVNLAFGRNNKSNKSKSSLLISKKGGLFVKNALSAREPPLRYHQFCNAGAPDL